MSEINVRLRPRPLARRLPFMSQCQLCLPMQQSERDRIERIAALIGAYWRAHPNAADAIEGVVWWMPELGAKPQSLVQSALDLLVSRNIAQKKLRADGSVIYSAKRPG